MRDVVEQAVLLELERTWQTLNWQLFGDEMRAPVIGLSHFSSLGRYEPHCRTILLQRTLTLTGDWPQVVEVLKHEMAHQFVAEVLLLKEPPHGPAFRQVCKQRGIDSSAAGHVPNIPSAHGAVVGRVRKLLALAQSENKHEAELAMASAQRLMLKHNLKQVNNPNTRYVARTVGGAQLRMSAWRKQLASLLNRHFFVSVLMGHTYMQRLDRRATIVEVVGTPENVEIAMYAHDFLVEAGLRLWRIYAKTRVVKSRRDKAQFLMGFVLGFREKLDEAMQEDQQRGLVWMGDAGLGQYFKRRYPRTVSSRRFSVHNSNALTQGRVVGRKTVIHRGITQRKTGGGLLS
jgi:hypothetical protein